MNSTVSQYLRGAFLTPRPLFSESNAFCGHALAHDPNYCSKHSPKDHRFFPQVRRACQGLLFDSLNTIVGLFPHVSTTTDLRSAVHLIRNAYETGRKLASDVRETMAIKFN